MNRELRFTPAAAEALRSLEKDPHRTGLLGQVRKTLGLLETNLRHPSLNCLAVAQSRHFLGHAGQYRRICSSFLPR